MPVSTEMVWVSTPGRTSSAIEQTMLVSPVTRVTVAARTGETAEAAPVTAASGTEAVVLGEADMAREGGNCEWSGLSADWRRGRAGVASAAYPREQGFLGAGARDILGVGGRVPGGLLVVRYGGERGGRRWSRSGVAAASCVKSSGCESPARS